MSDTGEHLPEISVCVPVHKAHPEPNLASMGRAFDEALGGLRGELVVVLNGISAEEAGTPPDARVVDLGMNRGVSIGWNSAAREARAPVLCFVNDDVGLGPRSLRMVHDALAGHADAGVAGPVGSTWDIPTGSDLGVVATDDLPSGAVRETDVVSGFFFATSKATYEAAGGFDEAYTPCGYEEVDFCATVRLDLGLRCYAVGGVVHEHEFGISHHHFWQRVRHNGRSESLPRIMRRNRRHYLAKWRDRAVS